MINSCNSDADRRIEDHRARLQCAGMVPMTADEILSGKTQAGVPRPTFLSGHEDDGSVHSVAAKVGGE